MRIFLLFVVITSSYIAFGQDTLNVMHKNSRELESHEFRFQNDSDSLICIFFSGFHGEHNTTQFLLPATDTVNNTLIFKLDFAKFDFYIDGQCKYYQVLVIHPHEEKVITIDLEKSDLAKEVKYFYVYSNLSEEKFMKKLPKRCLGFAFNFRSNMFKIPK